MILTDALSDTSASYIHMERYVNKGSPSGFTDEHNTSPETRAKGTNAEFFLCGVRFPDYVEHVDFGTKPIFFDAWDMWVHPDLIDDELFQLCVEVERQLTPVSPTSSSRTVRLNNNNWFAKLNYKGMIGRIDRQLAYDHAESAITITNRIEQAIKSSKLSQKFRFWREVFGRVYKIPFKDSFYEWGIVFREPDPFPLDKEIALIVPAFSLFSTDDKNPSHSSILLQLVERQHKLVEDFLFEDIIAPLCTAYFETLLICGLQLEAHAQNICLGLNKELSIEAIIAKDAESIDKDLSLIEDLGLEPISYSGTFKCLTRNQYNYQIMHSFMFDFKMGEYLITPLIQHASELFSINRRGLEERIRDLNRSYIRQLPTDFFPSDGKWYSYENIVHDRTKMRPYIANESPLYR